MYDVGVLPPYPLVDKLLQRPQYAQICGLPIVREGKVNFITVKYCNVFLVFCLALYILSKYGNKKCSYRYSTFGSARHTSS